MQFLLILIFIIINFKTISNFHLQPTPSDKNLSESICKITNDVIKSNTDTNDILIGNLGANVLLLAINELILCIDKPRAVIISNFDGKLSNKNLRKASIIILVMNKVDQVSGTFNRLILGTGTWLEGSGLSLEL